MDKVVLHKDFLDRTNVFSSNISSPFNDFNLMVDIFHKLSNKGNDYLTLSYSEISQLIEFKSISKIRWYLKLFKQRYGILIFNVLKFDEVTSNKVVFQLNKDVQYLNNGLNESSNDVIVFNYDRFKELKSWSKLAYFIFSKKGTKFPINVTVGKIRKLFYYTTEYNHFTALRLRRHIVKICNDLQSDFPGIEYKLNTEADYSPTSYNHLGEYVIVDVEFKLRKIVKA